MQDEQALQQQKQIEKEFLVTKTIGAQEVWDNLEDWKPSIQKEYDQLIHNKKAVRQITREELRELDQTSGLPIELLPGKMVHTRKAVSGDFRSRAVVCGNFSEATTAECYAGGADGVQIRAVIKCAAMKQWQLAATDIRVAFLNAPRRDRSKIVAMEVPKAFRAIGLATSDHVWVIEKALYGLTTSPRDWGLHRNEELPKVTWQVWRDDLLWNGTFKKTADDNLWRMEEVCESSGESRWTGLLSVYVDDLLVGGERASIDAALASVAKMWAVADVEWAEVENPLKFCGFEINADSEGDGFRVSQQRYEKEMLQRWGVEEGTDYPVFKVSEADEVPCEQIDPNQLRQAQAVAGSLLWLTTRTRPDILYGVATMSRLISKNPEKALQIGQALLKYIHKVPGGLHFSGRADGWGSRNQLKVPRNEQLIEIFSDISYAAGSGHRSIEGVIGFFAGTPLVWQCHQQPFATHSTAESELVSYCESLIAGRSLEALLCTMWGEPLAANPFQRVLYGDNAAAIGLAHGTANSSWRTRHLRIRASVLREALEPASQYPGGQWALMHLKGVELVADGLTKPLMGQSFDRFLQDLGMARRRDGAQAELQSGHGAAGQLTATLAVLIGSSLLSKAEAMSVEEIDLTPGDSDAVWLCGICLVMLGTVYACELLHSAVNCCIRRLWASSSKVACETDGEEVDLCESVNFKRSRSRNDPMTTSRSKSSRSKACASTSVFHPSSGSEDDSISLTRPLSKRMTSRSGSSIAAAERCAAEASFSAAEAKLSAAEAKNSAAAAEHCAAEASSCAVAASRAGGAAAERSAAEASESRAVMNPWNAFQHKHKGKGWTSQKLALMYHKEKSKKR